MLYEMVIILIKKWYGIQKQMGLEKVIIKQQIKKQLICMILLNVIFLKTTVLLLCI